MCCHQTFSKRLHNRKAAYVVRMGLYTPRETVSRSSSVVLVESFCSRLNQFLFTFITVAAVFYGGVEEGINCQLCSALSCACECIRIFLKARGFNKQKSFGDACSTASEFPKFDSLRS